MMMNLPDESGPPTRNDTPRTHPRGSFPHNVVITTPPPYLTRHPALAISMSPRFQLSPSDSPGSTGSVAPPSPLEVQMCQRLQALAAEAERTKQHMMTMNEHIKAQQLQIEDYKAQLRGVKEEAHISQVRETSHTAFLGDLVALLKQYGYQELHDIADTLSSDSIRRSYLERLACELTILRQARQLFSGHGLGQNVTSSTGMERTDTTEPDVEEGVGVEQDGEQDVRRDVERYVEQEVEQDIQQDIQQEVRRDVEHDVEEDYDVKHTPEELQSPYKVFLNAGPIPTS